MRLNSALGFAALISVASAVLRPRPEAVHEARDVIQSILKDLDLPVPRVGESGSFAGLKYEIRLSSIEAAGLGVFAAQDIDNGSVVWQLRSCGRRNQDDYSDVLVQCDDMRIRWRDLPVWKKELLRAPSMVRAKFVQWTCADNTTNGLPSFEFDDGRYFNYGEGNDVNVAACGESGEHLCASRDIVSGAELIEDMVADGVYSGPWWFEDFIDNVVDHDDYEL